MERYEFIQALIDKYNFKTYLELGVRDGNIFFTVDCKHKIAVDPKFAFGLKENLKKFLSKLNGSKYYDMTSDDFFTHHATEIFEKNKLNVVLVDGMHEFNFALNDILNSLNFLSEDGFVIVHDCNPLTERAACSYQQWKARNFEGIWNGDVWKTILFLNKTRADLKIFVADCDHGLGIITKSKTVKTLSSKGFTKESVMNLTFNDLEANRREYLNLRPATSLQQFLL